MLLTEMNPRPEWRSEEEWQRVEAEQARIRADYEPLIAAADDDAERRKLIQERWVKLVVAEAPPLTPEQIRIARAVFAAPGCPRGEAGSE